jgi:hypothetical protein
MQSISRKSIVGSPIAMTMAKFAGNPTPTTLWRILRAPAPWWCCPFLGRLAAGKLRSKIGIL